MLIQTLPRHPQQVEGEPVDIAVVESCVKCPGERFVALPVTVDLPLLQMSAYMWESTQYRGGHRRLDRWAVAS